MSNMNLPQMDECIIMELFTQSTNSVAVNMSNNNIKNIELNEIPGNFQEIDLSKNEIRSINLCDVHRKDINLSYNNMSEIAVNNVKCELLDISNNNIKNITLINCIIDKLDLNTNLIESITFMNTSIKEIDLSFNKIQYFESFPNDIEKLNLFSNKIIKISNMPNTLIKIDLGNNKLTEINYMSNNLISFDISKNHIDNFNVLILPKTLKLFDITENKIKDTSIFDNLEIETCLYDECQQNSEAYESDIEIKIMKKHIKKIEISDDYDDIFDDNSNETSDISSDSDILSFIQQKHNEKIQSETIKKQHEYIIDDEIMRALEEYKDTIKEEHEKKRELFSKSQNTLDPLEDSDSDETLNPEYDDYYIRWNIVI